MARLTAWAHATPESDLHVIHVRDWHDPGNPVQAEHLARFGAHCIAGSVGAEFVFRLDDVAAGKAIDVIDATVLSNFVDTRLPAVLARHRGAKGRALRLAPLVLLARLAQRPDAHFREQRDHLQEHFPGDDGVAQRGVAAEHRHVQPLGDGLQPVRLLLRVHHRRQQQRVEHRLLEADARETASALADCRYEEVTGNHITMMFEPAVQGVASAVRRFINNE